MKSFGRWTGTLGRTALLLAFVAAGVGAIVARLASEGMRQMSESDALFNQGKLNDSLLAARRAASFYVPSATHVALADSRMEAIAVGAESQKMHRTALLAWQAIRASQLVRPRFAGRDEARLHLANRRVAGLLASLGSAGAATAEDRRDSALVSEFERDMAPSRLGVLGQLGSLFAVGVGLVGVTIGAFPRGDVRYGSMAKYSGGLLVLGAASWAVCLLFA